MTSPVLQLRVPEDTLSRIDQARGDATRSAWLQRLIDRELAGPGPAHVTNGPSVTAAAPLDLADGQPSPGVAGSGPGCWQRNTSRFGLRRVPLCPACAVTLQGETYKREPPPGAARAMRRDRPAVSRAG